MPSPLHETIAEMLRAKPTLILSMLEALHVGASVDATVHTSPEALAPLVPDYRADRVFEVRDREGGLEYVVVVEVQLRRKRDKRFSLPVYQAVARARYRVPCIVIVVTVKERVARWARSPIALGGGSVFRALVVGPHVLRPELTARAPEFAFLGALAHGDGKPELVLETARAFEDLSDEVQALYFDLILASLSDEARRAVEALMQTKPYEYKSEFARRYFRQGVDRGREEGREEGREQGREEGLRVAIRSVLSARGLRVTKQQLRRLDACADIATLEEWARRAAVAARASEVFVDAST